MCDYSRRLIAWLDHELAENDAAGVERHIRACTDCRSQLDSYTRVSRAFDAYCNAVCDSAEILRAPRKVQRWAAVLSAAAAACALLLIFSRAPVERPRLPTQAAAPPAAVVHGPTPGAIAVATPIKRIRRKRTVAPVQSQSSAWMPAEPAIQIAIPAEAIFPPGAVPEGINFIADLSIAADGSVQRLRLQPRLAGFERRPTQP